jgi:acyl-CoA synthetase (AMP-forming)/AMP-acid ligase II
MWQGEGESESVTFGEFTNWAKAEAAYFRGQGLQYGDTVILIMPQGVPLMTAFAGAMLLGAVPAILAYPTFKVDPAKYRFGLAGVSANLRAKLIVLDESFPEELLQCVSLTGQSRLLRSGARPKSRVEPADLPEADPDHVAFIQHSAGTTGLQKGVALSHAAVLRQLSHLASALSVGPQDRIYSWLPLYHDMGLIACFILPMVCHLAIVMQSPSDWVMHPGSMLQLISEYRCSLTWIPNFAYQFVSRRVDPEDYPGLNLDSLRALINCSEPVRASSMDEFFEAYKNHGLRREALQACYAMAENVFAVTQSGINGKSGPCRITVDGDKFYSDRIVVPVRADHSRALCLMSSGQCLPENHVRIANANGEDLPEGAVGEILIRSDSMLEGYYNRPDLTAQALRDGFYWSGDVGFCLDRELYVVGRKKDLIIVAGKNIYPQDVEEIAFGHPAIHDGRAVAFGLYNRDLGTEDIVVVAEVTDEEQLKNPLPIESAIRNAVVGELGVSVRAVYLKPPRWIVKSTAGKSARATTREKLISEHPELQRDGNGANR